MKLCICFLDQRNPYLIIFNSFCINRLIFLLLINTRFSFNFYARNSNIYLINQ